MKQKTVLLAAATGYRGRLMAHQLKLFHFDSLLLIQNIGKSGFDPDVYVLVEADLCFKESFHNLCKGMDYAISTWGITRQKEDLSFKEDDYQANANLLDYLKVSGLDYCVVRRNGFLSDMREFLKMGIRRRILLFGNGKLLLKPIHSDDLARICVRALEWNCKELEIRGPDLLSQSDIARLTLLACIRFGKIIYLPDWIRKLTFRFKVFKTRQVQGSRILFCDYVHGSDRPKFVRVADHHQLPEGI